MWRGGSIQLQELEGMSQELGPVHAPRHKIAVWFCDYQSRNEIHSVLARERLHEFIRQFQTVPFTVRFE
ncbi:hypothetical protein PENTCL1PPCAC_13451, partial [Pristionchus entomophagus]